MKVKYRWSLARAIREEKEKLIDPVVVDRGDVVYIASDWGGNGRDWLKEKLGGPKAAVYADIILHPGAGPDRTVREVIYND